jgi:hypothetical protein
MDRDFLLFGLGFKALGDMLCNCCANQFLAKPCDIVIFRKVIIAIGIGIHVVLGLMSNGSSRV